MINENNQNDNKYKEEIITQIQNGMLPQTSRNIAIAIIKICVIIILFILIKIVVACLKSLADALTKLPIIKQTDKLGGIIYGLIRGALIVYIFLIVIELLIPFNYANTIYDQIQSSYITKIMFENNIIKLLFN